MPSVCRFRVLPALPESLKELDVIAKNMFWTWNPEFVELFKRVDSNLWSACGHNPVKLLGNISQSKLDKLAENQGFLTQLQQACEKLKSYIDRSSWYDKICPK